MSILDSILSLIPSIKKPDGPLTTREKLRWTALIMGVYFLMFSIPAFGVSIATLNQPALQLINVIFAARTGTLITVGIGPIVLSSIIIQLLQGADVIKINMEDPAEKGKFQSIQKLAAITIACVEAFIFTYTGYVPLASPAYFPIVVVQLAIAAVFVIFLDEMMVKWGLTSGINLFIAGGVAFSLVSGTINILFPSALYELAQGGATALPNAILAFGPLFFSAIIMLISIYAYDIKIELPLAFSQFRGMGGRLPIPFLYVSVLPVILATSLIVSMSVWFGFAAHITGSLANTVHFIAYYKDVPTASGAITPQLSGGIIYLISPFFPSPYLSKYGGVGGYGPYVTYLLTYSSPLYLPAGGVIQVPEYVHIITYTVMLVILCIVFGKFWIEMTGQSPKNVAEQLQEVGWQIPGFRRDPRVIEGVLEKYIPTITVLGSVFVGLLAAFSTLTGAVGTGMGVLLAVGIMYMIYQQLEQEKALDSYAPLQKFLS